MKALKLTVYEKEPGLYGREDTYNSPDGLWAYPESHVDGYAAEKRLTDAELAAEMFSAVFHEAECEVRGVRIEKGFPPRPGHPAVQRYVEMNHEFGRQADILRRFATLPHYDEHGHG